MGRSKFLANTEKLNLIFTFNMHLADHFSKMNFPLRHLADTFLNPKMEKAIWNRFSFCQGITGSLLVFSTDYGSSQK